MLQIEKKRKKMAGVYFQVFAIIIAVIFVALELSMAATSVCHLWTRKKKKKEAKKEEKRRKK